MCCYGAQHRKNAFLICLNITLYIIGHCSIFSSYSIVDSPCPISVSKSSIDCTKGDMKKISLCQGQRSIFMLWIPKRDFAGFGAEDHKNVVIEIVDHLCGNSNIENQERKFRVGHMYKIRSFSLILSSRYGKSMNYIVTVLILERTEIFVLNRYRDGI